MEFRASDELIGAPVGKFVTSTRWADKVEREVGRSSSALEQALGYGPGKLKDQEVLRIDLPFKPEYQPTFPNPSFQGANEKFIPGDLLPEECQKSSSCALQKQIFLAVRGQLVFLIHKTEVFLMVLVNSVNINAQRIKELMKPFKYAYYYIQNQNIPECFMSEFIASSVEIFHSGKSEIEELKNDMGNII